MGKRHTNFHILIDDPLTVAISAGVLFASGIAAVDQAAKGRAAHVLVVPPWHLPAIIAETLAAWEWLAANRASWRLTLLAQTGEELALARANGIEALLVHHNAFLDPAIHHPQPAAAKVFDAVHVANTEAFKRHHLASEVPGLALVTYAPAGGQSGRFAEVAAAYKHLASVNWNPARGHIPLSAHEVAGVIRQAHCGLVLSSTEGANFASAEYLMNGIPLVTTPSEGGREAFLDPRFTTVVEARPEAVAAAVAAWKAAPPDPGAVARSCLARGREDRLRLLDFLETSTGLNLRRTANAVSWSRLFTNRLRKAVEVDESSIPDVFSAPAAALRKLRRQDMPKTKRGTSSPFTARLTSRLLSQAPREPGLRVLPDAVVRALGPGHRSGEFNWYGGGIYSKDGVAEPSLARHQRAGAGRLLPAWQRTGPPIAEALFAGPAKAHFGHFLCESIGRLWALDHFSQDMPLIYLAGEGPDCHPGATFHDFMRLLGLANPVVTVTHVADVRRLWLPREMWFPMDGVPLDPRLRRWFRSRFPAAAPPPGPDLYLSRRGLGPDRGHVLCEEVIERGMASAGYHVLRPETLSLAEQAAAFGAARRIVFCESSALHLLVLTARPDARIAMIRRRPLSMPELEVARQSLSTPDVVFLSAFRRFWTTHAAHETHTGAAELDFPRLWSQLAEAGFIGPGPRPEPALKALEAARRQASSTRPYVQELDPSRDHARNFTRRLPLLHRKKRFMQRP